MDGWWQELSQVNRAFYYAASFFSIFFAWQMISALLGLGDHDVDINTDGADTVDVDHAHPHGSHDADATMAAFKLLSVRSLVAFFTLFSWGGALYLQNGVETARAMMLATVWGLAGMSSVAFILYLLPKLTHTGNQRIASCIGSEATVYLDIPENGIGEVRVMMTGVISTVKARASTGEALKAGTPVKVTRLIDALSVEVTPLSK